MWRDSFLGRRDASESKEMGLRVSNLMEFGLSPEQMHQVLQALWHWEKQRWETIRSSAAMHDSVAESLLEESAMAVVMETLPSLFGLGNLSLFLSFLVLGVCVMISSHRLCVLPMGEWQIRRCCEGCKCTTATRKFDKLYRGCATLSDSPRMVFLEPRIFPTLLRTPVDEGMIVSMSFFPSRNDDGFACG